MLFSTDNDTFIDEVKAILPVSVTTDREKLWPFIEQAERKYIKPLLGDSLYSDLSTFYNDRDAWSSGSGEDEEKTTELLRLIRISEMNLAYFIGFDLLNVILSTTGFQRADSENFKGLYKYQEASLKSYFENTGYNGIDDMLKYIDDNIEHFPEWEESDIYASRKTAFIKDAETFDAICYINKSRLIFLRLQRFITEVIDFEIKPLLGEEYENLLSELAKDSPDDAYSALVPYIQKPLAYLSCAKLIEKTGNITDRGLFFEGKNSLYPDDTTIRSATSDEIINLMGQYKATGYKYLEALRQYLIAEEFTHGSEDGDVFSRDNTDKKIFVA